MATPTDASIQNMFPHATIPPINAPNTEPTYETIHHALTQLNANATSIPSTGGDGILGHLVLTIGSAAYMTLSVGNVDHPRPAPPAAIDIPAGATGAIISELRHQHTDARKTFSTYFATDAALKKQLLEATDETYVTSLKHRTHGFALVRTRTIVEHLLANYGTITSNALTANEEQMQTAWDPTTPIEPLFAQIDDGAAFAQAGASPYTDMQLVRYGYNIIFATGRLSLACRDWRLKDEADKTWANLCTHFKTAHMDHLLSVTPDSTSFQANAAINPAGGPPPDPAPPDDATQAYLANLAEAAVANNAQVTALAATITQLQQQMRTLTQQQAPATRAPAPRSRARRAPAAAPPAAAPAPAPGSRRPTVRHQRYCWTHGRCHEGAECLYPAEGHQPLATLANRMGGSDRWCQEVGS